MGIYIKGMEMPKSPRECRFYDTDPFGIRKPFCAIQSVCNGLSDCPLIEIPLHGRLIDADALMLIIQEYLEEYSDLDGNGWHNLKWCAMSEAEMAINDAPTIIEAEEEE